MLNSYVTSLSEGDELKAEQKKQQTRRIRLCQCYDSELNVNVLPFPN